MSMKEERRNPWMGLASYCDPETSDYPFLFCGRKDESYDVSQLIEDNIFVTLYGKSGTGKTSLLNAGIFPILRKDHFVPISVRLGIEAIGTSFQKCIIEKIRRTVADRKGTIETVDVVPLSESETKDEYLWSYFARTRYEDKDANLVYPVIVLDQFEEVFRGRQDEAETLLRQIYYLMNENHALSDRMIDGAPYIYDFNFRFVVTIREDDLFRLEDSIDSNFLPEMKQCRFRLRNLSEEGARDVILLPAGDLFNNSDRDRIAEKIISISRDGTTKTVSSNILSLVCSRIFAEHQKDGSSEITLPMVEDFIKGNPFERFYKEATHGLSHKEKTFIESHLVDSSGRRNSVPESDFLFEVKNGKRLFEGEQKILQRVSTSSGAGDIRVELIHDSFCEPLAVLKAKRMRSQVRGRVFIALAAASLCAIVAVYTSYLNSQLRREESINQKLRSQVLMSLSADSLAVGLADANEGQPEFDAKEVDGIITVNGIEYEFADPTTEQINQWRNEYYSVCKKKVAVLMLGSPYTIPSQMLEDHPCLVYLVLTSKSLSSDSERQSWFDLYHLMNELQIDQLYDILYREQHKLGSIDIKYEKRREEIRKKYESIDMEASNDPMVLNTDAYVFAKQGDFSKAHELIERAIDLAPEDANLFDSKGEFYMMEGKMDEALKMWKKVIKLDPDFLEKHNGDTPLHNGLRESGLIKK